MHTLLLLALFQAAPATSAAAEPLRSGCSPSDQQIASVAPADRVRVEMALAGEAETCYKIRVFRASGDLTGYVLGANLPAITQFIHRRERASEEETVSEARVAPLPSPKATKDPTKPDDPLISTQFPEFSGSDADGKEVSLSDLKGRAILVTFWSPAHAGTIGQLAKVIPLYKQFQAAGLAAIGVSMSEDRGRINSALYGISLAWPQVADQVGLAKLYQVDPNQGKTFLLDSNHRIVADGPMGPDMAKAVHQLLAAPQK